MPEGIISAYFLIRLDFVIVLVIDMSQSDRGKCKVRQRTYKHVETRTEIIYIIHQGNLFEIIVVLPEGDVPVLPKSNTEV